MCAVRYAPAGAATGFPRAPAPAVSSGSTRVSSLEAAVHLEDLDDRGLIVLRRPHYRQQRHRDHDRADVIIGRTEFVCDELVTPLGVASVRGHHEDAIEQVEVRSRVLHVDPRNVGTREDVTGAVRAAALRVERGPDDVAERHTGRHVRSARRGAASEGHDLRCEDGSATRLDWRRSGVRFGRWCRIRRRRGRRRGSRFGRGLSRQPRWHRHPLGAAPRRDRSSADRRSGRC